jgi:hypothetical protein
MLSGQPAQAVRVGAQEGELTYAFDAVVLSDT